MTFLSTFPIGMAKSGKISNKIQKVLDNYLKLVYNPLGTTKHTTMINFINKISDIFNFICTLTFSLMLWFVIIGVCVALPVYYFVLTIPCNI